MNIVIDNIAGCGRGVAEPTRSGGTARRCDVRFLVEQPGSGGGGAGAQFGVAAAGVPALHLFLSPPCGPQPGRSSAMAISPQVRTVGAIAVITS
jgi:hypothetical protein